MLQTILLYIVIFLYGIVIGSFLNVLIYRIPKKENIVTTRSHCMNCGYQLKWYDLVPLFSYLVLGGKCRKCKAHISVQYPVIEALNGVLYLLVFWKYGMSVDSLVYCLLFSTLPVCQCIFASIVLCYRWQSHRWRRCEADGSLRTVTRLETHYFRIFTGMYHWFRDPSDPYESKRRRTCPRYGTISLRRGGNRCPVGQ